VVAFVAAAQGLVQEEQARQMQAAQAAGLEAPPARSGEAAVARHSHLLSLN
jgi:hypothetical protein